MPDQSTIVSASRSEWLQNPLTTIPAVDPIPTISNLVEEDDNTPLGILFDPQYKSSPSDAYPVPPFNAPPSETRTRNTRVATKLSLSSDVFVASQEISGRLQLDCSNNRQVKIGLMCIHLSGYEDVASSTRRYTSSRSNKKLFLYNMLELQSRKMVPSEAVYPGPCDEDGMWAARVGSTVFDFALKLENATNAVKQKLAGLPSSFWNSSFGGVRYIISATVQVKIGFKRPQTLVIYREAQIVEHVPLFLSPNIVPSLNMWAQDKRIVGWLNSRKGEVRLKARCHVREFESESNDKAESGVWLSGGIGHVYIEVSNGSKRKVPIVKICLIRRLKTFSQANCDITSLIPVQFSREVITEKILRKATTTACAKSVISKPEPQWAEKSIKKFKKSVEDEWCGVKGGESCHLLLTLDIPANIRTVRNSLLIDISYAVQVTVFAKGSPGIFVEVPVTILHPMSVLQSSPEMSRFSRYKSLKMLTCDTIKTNNTSLMEKITTTSVIGPCVNVFDGEDNIVAEQTHISGSLYSRAGIITPRSATVTGALGTRLPLSLGVQPALVTRSKTDTTLKVTGDGPESVQQGALDQLESLSANLIKSTSLHPPKRAPPPPPSAATIKRNRESIYKFVPPHALSHRVSVESQESAAPAVAQTDIIVRKEFLLAPEQSQQTLVSVKGEADEAESSELAKDIDRILSKKLVERALEQLQAPVVESGISVVEHENVAITIDAMFEDLERQFPESQ
ncbi:hypothetical protein BC830DRAFT_1126607 [Chytriomyces sp. MP71]|nr:hypothetical protein BC830DRAFT_1126607 [Chytriomyces sp. MP71]